MGLTYEGPEDLADDTARDLAKDLEGMGGASIPLAGDVTTVTKSTIPFRNVTLYGLSVSEDGLTLSILEQYASSVDANTYTMSTPFDLTTLSGPTTTANFKSYVGQSVGQWLRDGSRLAVAGSVNSSSDAVWVKTPTSPWLGDGTQTSKNYGNLNMYGVTLVPDGTKVFYKHNQVIYEATLGTPYDMTTASAGSSTFASSFINYGGITFSNDGMYFFVGGNAEKQVEVYELAAPFDLSEATEIFTATLPDAIAVRGIWIDTSQKLFFYISHAVPEVTSVTWTG